MRGMRLRHLSTLSARRNSKLCRGINQRFYTHQVWTLKKIPFCIDNIVHMASGGPLGSNLAQNAPKMAKKYPKSIFKRKTIGGLGHRLRLGVGPIPKFFTFPIYVPTCQKVLPNPSPTLLLGVGTLPQLGPVPEPVQHLFSDLHFLSSIARTGLGNCIR